MFPEPRAGRRRARAVALAVLVAAAAAMLTWAAVALANDRAYNGPVAGADSHAGVEFGAHFRKGHARYVFRFEFHNVPAQCQGSGTTAISDPLGIHMKIRRHRKFSGHAKLNGGKVTANVKGRFKRGFKKATGTLRVKGTVPGCAAADTGVLKWQAPEVGS
jgi:hypothetical protein